MKNEKDANIQITFYSSILCPRCFLIRKYLREISEQNQRIEVNEIDIMLHPIKMWQNEIRMIPALAAKGKKHLSGIFLNKTQIEQFVDDLLP